MSASLKASADGTQAIIQVNGVDKVVVDAGGIASGYKTGSIPDTALVKPLTQRTMVNATGTFVDFTSIPTWVKRITLSFFGVSTNGTSIPQVQLVDSGVVSSGYVSATSGSSGSTISTTGIGSGFGLVNSPHQAAYGLHGNLYMTKMQSDAWVVSGSFFAASGIIMCTAGTLVLSSVLTAVRVTTVNGTDTFDAGQLCILYD